MRRIVRHCHERFDGTGYPDALAGEHIPLEPRIILVCDAYLAMTEARPDRGPLEPALVDAELRRGAGTQFDPGVVAVLLEALRHAAADAA